MKYITGKDGLKIRGYWLMVLACILITGCSSDDTDEQATSTLHFKAYTAAFQDTNAPTRAATEIAGFTEYAPSADYSVGLFLLSGDATTATAQYIRRSNNSWHSQIKVTEGIPYYIYGFMPKHEQMQPSMTKDGEHIQIILDGIDVVSAEDVCVITGVHETENSLVEGAFTYTGKADNNAISVLMDHLYAAVRFKMTIGTDYQKLRSIKLKGMTLRASKASTTATVVLKPNNTGASPIKEIDYSVTGTSKEAVFFESASGVELSADDYQVATCYFAPAVSDQLTLTVTYDVYDKNGNKIRENNTATNQLPYLAAGRGQQVTVNLTIEPTYLLVLSDADLDNPALIIGN